jgi:hypothetical protein
VATLSSLTCVGAASADTVRLKLVRTTKTSSFVPSSPDPSGIVYRRGVDRLLIADSEVDETPLYRDSNLFTATRLGLGFGTGTTLSFGNREPSDLGSDPRNGTLYVSDDDRDRISRVRPGPDAAAGTDDDTVSSFGTAGFGSTDPEGVEFDPATGRAFICDGSDLEVYSVNAATGNLVSHFDLARYGLRDCEGLGIDRRSRTLLAVDWRTDAIYRLGTGGQLVRKLSLAAIPTSSLLVADVTLAPSSSPTDSSSALNYWIVDRHVDNKRNPDENDGLLYEMSG